MHTLILIPIWNRKLLVVTPPDDIIALAKEYKLGREMLAELRQYPPTGNELALAYHTELSGKYVLWFAKHPSSATLVHETNHITKYIMEYVGVEDDEASAYTQDWLFSEIRKRLRTH